MNRIVKIPVRSEASHEREASRTPSPATAGAATEATGAPSSAADNRERAIARPAAAQSVSPEGDMSPGGAAKHSTPAERGRQAEDTDWKDLALRLQAEMDNYRKRQQRLAQDQIEAERQRLLRGFLKTVDDLERVLAAPAGDDRGLREGIQLIQRAAIQQLQQEGVERIQASHQLFDPTWHEAVGSIPHDGTGAAPGTVIQVLEPGYRLGDRLLRPAKVIVAV